MTRYETEMTLRLQDKCQELECRAHTLETTVARLEFAVRFLEESLRALRAEPRNAPAELSLPVRPSDAPTGLWARQGADIRSSTIARIG
ncbi:MAG TPA: hypothetical protein DCM86_17065 [Verrucomicrobiales bacterium]|nr:hypothetical protein [Verrucomicrobiales bacterium]